MWCLKLWICWKAISNKELQQIIVLYTDNHFSPHFFIHLWGVFVWFYVADINVCYAKIGLPPLSKKAAWSEGGDPTSLFDLFSSFSRGGGCPALPLKAHLKKNNKYILCTNTLPQHNAFLISKKWFCPFCHTFCGMPISSPCRKWILSLLSGWQRNTFVSRPEER